MNSYTITFDSSNEDVPCLIVARKNMSFLGDSFEIVKTITGDEAERLWNELTVREVGNGKR